MTTTRPGRSALLLAALLALPACELGDEAPDDLPGVAAAATFTGSLKPTSPSWATHTFAVTAGATIDVELRWAASSADLNLFLYDPSGALVAQAKTASKPEALRFKATAAGTYKIGIKCLVAATTYTADVTTTAPPAPGAATIFGESLDGHGTQAEAVAYALERFGKIPVARVYFGEGKRLPIRWSDASNLRALPAGTHVVMSFKPTGYGASDTAGLRAIAGGAADADVRALMASRPAGTRVWISLYHEPEDNFIAGNFSSADYKAAWSRLGATVRGLGDAKVRSALILMRYTLGRTDRDWRDFYVANGPDVFAWDAYNFANNPDPKRYQTAEEMFGPIVDVAAQTGKPWGIGELGSDTAAGDDGGAGRAAWLQGLADFALASGRCEFMAYWDRQSLYTTTDYTIDDPKTIAVWKALANR